MPLPVSCCGDWRSGLIPAPQGLAGLQHLNHGDPLNLTGTISSPFRWMYLYYL